MTPRLLSAGVWGTVALSLAGVWLLVARPLCEGRPVAGAVWTAAARNDAVVGAVLLVAGVAGILGQLAFALREVGTDPIQGAGVVPERRER